MLDKVLDRVVQATCRLCNVLFVFEYAAKKGFCKAVIAEKQMREYDQRQRPEASPLFCEFCYIFRGNLTMNSY
jgi:hypothetical protein